MGKIDKRLLFQQFLSLLISGFLVVGTNTVYARTGCFNGTYNTTWSNEIIIAETVNSNCLTWGYSVEMDTVSDGMTGCAGYSDSQIVGSNGGDNPVPDGYTYILTSSPDYNNCPRSEGVKRQYFLNQRPVPVYRDLVVSPNGNITIQLNATDLDFDILTYSIISGGGPKNGSASISQSGSFSYTPDPGFTGYELVFYHVTDGKSLPQSGQITITVGESVSNNLVLENFLMNAIQGLDSGLMIGGAYYLQSDGTRVDVNDSDLIVNLDNTNQPQYGEIIRQDGMNNVFQYRPNLNYIGPDEFGFVVQDNVGRLGYVVVSINVQEGDLDSDGVFNNSDNCINAPNPGQADFDGDGLGDVCDDDLDQDGVNNIGDAFPYDPAETLDTDGDGIGNNADLDDDNDGVSDIEEIAAGRNPLVIERDTDGDGFLDYIDNCSDAPNPDQADFDGNGLGDACDDDIDGDGVINERDAFPFDPTETVDTDKDGIGNNIDLDDDGDGMSDADEIAAGRNPLVNEDAVILNIINTILINR